VELDCASATRDGGGLMVAVIQLALALGSTVGGLLLLFDSLVRPRSRTAGRVPL